MSHPDKFFLVGPTPDPAYENVRDSPNLEDARVYVEELWPKYKHLADRHLREDARSHFLQRFWEMYLACTLIHRGFELHRVGGEGPEFYFLHNENRVWVEAIAPGPGNGPDRVPDYKYGESISVPTEQILLRFTSALRDKHFRRNAAVAKGIVRPDEPVILAINSRGIPHAPHGAEMPYIVKALLPFGPLTVSIDRNTHEIIDTFHQYQPSIQKKNESTVSKESFLNPEYSTFPAVIHSGIDCANHPDELGGDFLLLHNPTAAAPLPDSLFPWSRQLRYKDNELVEIPREV